MLDGSFNMNTTLRRLVRQAIEKNKEAIVSLNGGSDAIVTSVHADFIMVRARDNTANMVALSSLQWVRLPEWFVAENGAES